MDIQKLPHKIIDRMITSVFRLFAVDKLTNTQIRRRKDLAEIGSKYGGWVIPASIFDKDSICYCAGCGEDITFDLGLIDKFGCDVFAFDPTPRAIEHVKKAAGNNAKYHFSAIGLWDENTTLKFFVPKNPAHVSHSLLNLQNTKEHIEVPVERLSKIMKENEHKAIDLLKLDIEGAEYKVIESIVADNIDIKVICVEYDECFNPLDRDYKKRIQESVNRLTGYGYSLVYSQGNGNYTFVKEPLEG